jgi:opacity protein-like surface antigen
MFKVLKIVLIAGCAVTGFAATGFTADLDQPIFVEQAPDDLVPVEIGNGWYIRGDIGYAASHKGGTHTFRTFNPVAGPGVNPYADQTFVTSETDSGISIGGGVGYQFNDWFRVDGTIDRFGGNFSGSTFANQPCVTATALINPLYVGTACASNDAQDYSAYQFMANAYVDLGTYVGVTPYVGAGIGMTSMNWGDLTNSSYCVAGTAACPTGPAATTILPVTHTGANDWRLTYSVMAGLGYQVSKNVKLDLGYRYSKIDSGNQFNFDAATATAGASGVQGKDAGYDRHEVRLGFRYSLW